MGKAWMTPLEMEKEKNLQQIRAREGAREEMARTTRRQNRARNTRRVEANAKVDTHMRGAAGLTTYENAVLQLEGNHRPTTATRLPALMPHPPKSAVHGSQQTSASGRSRSHGLSRASASFIGLPSPKVASVGHRSSIQGGSRWGRLGTWLAAQVQSHSVWRRQWHAVVAAALEQAGVTSSSILVPRNSQDAEYQMLWRKRERNLHELLPIRPPEHPLRLESIGRYLCDPLFSVTDAPETPDQSPSPTPIRVRIASGASRAEFAPSRGLRGRNLAPLTIDQLTKRSAAHTLEGNGTISHDHAVFSIST